MTRVCIRCNEPLTASGYCYRCRRTSAITICEHRAELVAWRVVDDGGVLMWVVLGERPVMYVGDEQSVATLLGTCWRCRATFLLPAREARELKPMVRSIPLGRRS